MGVRAPDKMASDQLHRVEIEDTGPELDVIELGLDRHQIECPHCQEQTIHNWPGTTILFAMAKCTQCGKRFLIALNKPQTA